MLKNILLGVIGGGLLGATIATVAVAMMMSPGRETGTYAAIAGVMTAPLASVLGGIAGSLAATRSPFNIGLICGGCGLFLGTAVMLILLSFGKGNVVMGALAMMIGSAGGFVVGAAVAKWRKAKTQ